jgi:hypothetical protein
MYALIFFLALLLQSPVNQAANTNPGATDSQQRKSDTAASGACINVGGTCSVGKIDSNSEQQQPQASGGFLHSAYELAGVVSGLATVALLIFVGIQTKATYDTLQLTHRPKIIVRNIVIPPLKFLNRKSPMNKWTQELTGYYAVANVGGLPATICHVVEGIWVEKGLPMERPDRDQAGRKVNIILAPGESKEIDFPMMTIPAEDARALINGEANAFFLIHFDYVDSSKIIRRVSACRRYDPDSEQFTRVDNPDYEYAD